MIEELQQFDVSVLDSLIDLRRERDALRQRLARMKEAASQVSEAVLARVRSDYETRIAALDAKAEPLKVEARASYERLKPLLAGAQEAFNTLRLDQEELELRHQLGEFDDEAYRNRVAQLGESLRGAEGRSAEISELVARFVGAFDSPEELAPSSSSQLEQPSPPGGAAPSEAPHEEDSTLMLPPEPPPSPEPPPLPPLPPLQSPSAGVAAARRGLAAESELAEREKLGPQAERVEIVQTVEPGKPIEVPSPGEPWTPLAPSASGSGSLDTQAHFTSSAPPATPPGPSGPPTPPDTVTNAMPTARTAGPRPRLEALDADLDPQPHFLEPLTFIGRTPENQVRIYKPAVSRRHAQITETDSGWLLRDLSSENGTYVNGQRITERLLVEGDRVQFGTSRFVLRITS
jgi:hypothetical protein